jgi:hypothetical protein
MSEENFQIELAALLDKYPDKAKMGFAIKIDPSDTKSSASPEVSISPTSTENIKKRCIKYIYIPGRGVKCVKWE